jgi:hypothetical protein
LTRIGRGNPPVEQRSAGALLVFMAITVGEKMIDAVLGHPVDRGTKATINKVVETIREQFPSIRIGVDD